MRHWQLIVEVLHRQLFGVGRLVVPLQNEYLLLELIRLIGFEPVRLRLVLAPRVLRNGQSCSIVFLGFPQFCLGQILDQEVLLYWLSSLSRLGLRPDSLTLSDSGIRIQSGIKIDG